VASATARPADTLALAIEGPQTTQELPLRRNHNETRLKDLRVSCVHRQIRAAGTKEGEVRSDEQVSISLFQVTRSNKAFQGKKGGLSGTRDKKG